MAASIETLGCIVARKSFPNHRHSLGEIRVLGRPREEIGEGVEVQGFAHLAESEPLRTGFRRKPDSVPMIADSR
jgi:hypothetical protein